MVTSNQRFLRTLKAWALFLIANVVLLLGVMAAWIAFIEPATYESVNKILVLTAIYIVLFAILYVFFYKRLGLAFDPIEYREVRKDGLPAQAKVLEIERTRWRRRRGRSLTLKPIRARFEHFIEGDALPGVGETVTGQLNWEQRYKAMRTHTAMHILCGVIWRDHQVSVTGGNMEWLSGRMDFEFGELTREMIAEIEQTINAEVQANRDVRVNFLPREQAFQIPDLIRTKINLLPEGIEVVRTVEIIGLDLQADGGTHVHNTREVGPIHITKYHSKGGANKRLYIELDEV